MNQDLKTRMQDFEEITIQPDSVMDVEILNELTNVNEEELSMSETAQNIDGVATDILNGIQAQEELEQIAEVTETSLEKGGLTEEAAEMASIAIESIRQKLGYESSFGLIPVTESFSVDHRHRSSQMVVESITDTIKTIWERIKQVYARFKEFIIELIDKIISTAAGVNRALKKLEEKLKRIPTNAKMKENTLPLKRVANAFSWEKKASAATVGLFIENAIGLAAASIEVQDAIRITGYSAIRLVAERNVTEESYRKFVQEDKAAWLKVVKLMEAVFQKQGRHYGPVNLFTIKDIAEATVLGPFVNQKLLFPAYLNRDEKHIPSSPVSANFTARNQNTEQMFIMFFVPYDLPGKVDQIQAATRSEIEGLFKNTFALSNGLQEYKKIQKNYTEITQAIQKMADSIIKQTTMIAQKDRSAPKHNEELSLKDISASIHRHVASITRIVHQFGSIAPNIAYETVRYATDYLKASIDNLEYEEVKEEKSSGFSSDLKALPA